MRRPASGELTKRVALMRWVEEPTENGGLDRNWQLIAERWAKIEVVGSQQFWGTAQINENITHRIWLRFEPLVVDLLTMTGQTQIKYGGFVYRVKRASDFEERHQFIVLEVEQLVLDYGD